LVGGGEPGKRRGGSLGGLKQVVKGPNTQFVFSGGRGVRREDPSYDQKPKKTTGRPQVAP